MSPVSPREAFGLLSFDRIVVVLVLAVVLVLVLVVVVVFTLNLSFYPTTSALPPVSLLILHARDTNSSVTDSDTEKNKR